MTGSHEFKSGVTHTIFERERMSLKSTTIAQVLKTAGYTNGTFGKWHLGDAEPYQPGRRGFDEVFIHGCGGIGQDYPGACADAPGNRYFDQAIRSMDAKRTGKTPFFVYITPNAPHAPLDCPPEDQKMQCRSTWRSSRRCPRWRGPRRPLHRRQEHRLPDEHAGVVHGRNAHVAVPAPGHAA
jgi:arylsulfatase A-like enzyme